MEEMSPAVAVTLSLSNPICDNSGIASNLEITRLKLVTETASLLSDPAESMLGRDGSCCIQMSEVSDETMAETGGKSVLQKTIPKSENEEDGMLTVGDDPNGIVSEEWLPMDTSSEISMPIAVEIEKIEKGQIIGKVISLGEPSVEKKSSIDLSTVVANRDEIEKVQLGRGGKSVFELDYIPLWGSVSICGKRPEMEDAVVAVPAFMKVPIKMFVGDHVINGLSQSLSHITTHFFGVYDGHGGSQVANYCCDRIHFALSEELKDIGGNIDGGMSDDLQIQWQNAFTRCFEKVDDEIGGKVNRSVASDNADACDSSLDPIAPETVGSTAIVALISSSHVIVANCGDSRAVLYRGKEPIVLSIDHKPNREDEYARIEASGGKVIQWNGHRVFGVLAMSRSIGDRYLKPWIIPEPEVMFIPRTREDECLILASDGLWDVMTNNEACEVARRRILLWHKKNGDSPLAERGQGIDPAAQAAAEYLSVLALQKGSRDNISVIVVDLKAQRKFKNKS
ncbi:protein phosphatase 2C 16-like [Actinidia eriantha]|uniref:protein phosphatase 2C 16-like n=1 Tax=Actinidia eriantha TaxID=165200 RepID=UPI002585146B|nr:protein phosphatase 2C 16-like [Actinidia eriantha]XP_057504436.1 protein phosphatase 2C 16-like [Actinidia eriantha]